ncbi:hypothetical protein [Geodermatophilus sp. CPCC 206100]|uniref:hypothetical protein n=1 Tax=Geodermatophilus sp. CPCC 206100 TaxID=3020054 RepID=UPI003B003995
MRTTSSAPPAHRTRRVIGSIGVLAAAAAVAGLGTYGTFTDSTTPVDTEVDTGVVSIALSPAANQATVPFVSGGWVPGDDAQVVIDLVNDGDAPLSAVTLALRAPSSSVLDSDSTHGLQMVVESCSLPWEVSGAGYRCAADVESFYTGPVVMDRALSGARALAPGGVDHLRAAVTLPATAGNGFQDASSVLEFVFTGVQRDGTDR